ncbi:MAG: hypothetical protein AAGA57_01645 [Planctomycetota bacterium]
MSEGGLEPTARLGPEPSPEGGDAGEVYALNLPEADGGGWVEAGGASSTRILVGEEEPEVVGERRDAPPVVVRTGWGEAAADAHLGLLLWCLWLLLCWLGLLWRGGVTSAGWGLTALAAAGLVVVWPCARLCQADHPGWGRRWWAGLTLVEWVQLMIVWQAVVWPLKWTAGWGMSRTLAISVVVAGWSLGAAGWLAWGRRQRGAGARVFAALGAGALAWGGPLVVLAGGPAEAARMSAVSGTAAMARGVVSPYDAATLGGAAGAAFFGAVVLLWGLLVGRGAGVSGGAGAGSGAGSGAAGLG